MDSDVLLTGCFEVSRLTLELPGQVISGISGQCLPAVDLPADEAHQEMPRVCLHCPEDCKLLHKLPQI